MARKKTDEEYQKTFAFRFHQWLSGEKDPYIGNLEMKKESIIDCRTEAEELAKEERESKEKVYDDDKVGYKISNVVYIISSILFCIVLSFVMILMTSKLPEVGTVDRPVNNEVAKVYTENGIDDTGAVNTVTGMILNYRAFDTFGETCVLFIATTCVMILLMKKESEILSHEKRSDRRFEPKGDIILQKIVFLLVPIIFIFGIYVIFNGHLSPGGGFSGGALIGAGMILYAEAFGFQKMQKFFNEETYKVVKVAALCSYCAVISYYIIMGANDLNNHISLGTPGMIFSAGIILWINLFVGIEVACTMYAFYALFRRGGL